MDNYISQQMQNWKKMMIMDPLLNNLFDHSLNIKDFIHDKILTQDHEQIVQIYSRLSSVKHAISKHIQKEVQTKHQKIEASFLSKHKITNQLKLSNQQQITERLKNIQNFNENYQNVKQNIRKLEKVNKLIRFTKGLQKFKINCRLLKTFMKDHTSVQENTSKQQEPSHSNSRQLSSGFNTNNQSLNLPKISKLLKQLNILTTKNDFSGIKYYETQKQFVNNSRAILFCVAEKQLHKSIAKYQECMVQEIRGSKTQYSNSQLGETPHYEDRTKMLEQQIRQKFKILQSVNRIKDFLTSFVKKTLKQTVDILKALFQTLSVEDFSNFFKSQVFQTLLSNSKILIRIQQILVSSMLSNGLAQSGMPNLFQKYMERIISYFSELIKWNQDQQNKQMQKRRAQTLKGPRKDDIKSLQIKELISNKNLKTKTPLTLKYPTLLRWLSILINKIHEQVLVKGEYNLQRYEFYSKKQDMMSTLLPISQKFYQFFDQVSTFRQFNKISPSKINEKLAQKAQLLELFYSKIIGIRPQPNAYKQTSGLSFLIEGINSILIAQIQSIIAKEFQEENFSKFQRQQKVDFLKTVYILMHILDRKQVLKCYTHIQITVDHIKRLKVLKNLINYNQQKLIAQVRQGQKLPNQTDSHQSTVTI